MNLSLTTIHKFLRGLTAFSLKKPGIFVVFMAAFTALAAWFLVTHLQVRTNTDEMIDPDVAVPGGL